MENKTNQGGILKKIFSKRNIYYFFYTTLFLSFFVLYILVGFKLYNNYKIVRTNLFYYKGDFGSEIYLNLKKIYYEVEIYTKYYRFVAFCIFFIGLSFGIDLFRFIGFKLNITKKSKEEFSYEFIGFITVDIISILIIIMVLLLFDQEQIANLSDFNNYLFLTLYLTINTITKSIVKKKLKKLKKEKIKSEYWYLYEKN